MKHTIELDDLELTALVTHLEGQNEIMCESRLTVVIQVKPQIEKKCY
tara:strand:- start:5871 stop:6011 length:141 start_codon:yes stop_codon:yes gene_type:complete